MLDFAMQYLVIFPSFAFIASYGCYFSLSLPRGFLGLSMVYDCGIVWSCSLFQYQTSLLYDLISDYGVYQFK